MKSNKDFEGEDGTMNKERKKRKELEKKLAELRGSHPDHRLFRAKVTTATPAGVRINEGKVVQLHKDQPNPRFEAYGSLGLRGFLYPLGTDIPPSLAQAHVRGVK